MLTKGKNKIKNKRTPPPPKKNLKPKQPLKKKKNLLISKVFPFHLPLVALNSSLFHLYLRPEGIKMKLNMVQQKTYFFYSFEGTKSSVFHLPIYPDKCELLPTQPAGLGEEGTQAEQERVRLVVSDGEANRREQPTLGRKRSLNWILKDSQLALVSQSQLELAFQAVGII